MSNDLYYKRQFLNPEEGGGICFVEATVCEVVKRNGMDAQLDATLKLGDCNRVVELDFGWCDREGVEHRRTKAKRLLAVVKAFTTAVLDACDEAEAHNE